MPENRQIKNALRQLLPLKYEVILLSLLALSMGLLITGLSLPILTLKKFIFFKSTFSVVSGIESLWKDGHGFLAFIILLFSVFFPMVKLAVVLLVWFKKLAVKKRRTILFWLEIMGKWSMLDVFVVAVMIVAVRFGILAGAEPRLGIYFFASSIVLAMGTTMWVGQLARKNSRIDNPENAPPSQK